MTGLLKNNFYASLSNVKVFSGLMVLLGFFVVAADNAVPSLLIGYILLSITGFSVNSAACLQRENASKWNRYKLTTPIKRSDIVKSYYISLSIWLFAGSVLAGVCITLSVLIHGFPFDLTTDVLMLFTSGISVSLLMGALFFPLFYIGGEEKNEAVLLISLIGAIGIFLGLTSLINYLFSPLTILQLILSAAFLLAVSLLAFLLSLPLTVRIYKRKDI